jgi:signal transduction histidine kinase/ligand-binding sensor domain-containing protein
MMLRRLHLVPKLIIALLILLLVFSESTRSQPLYFDHLSVNNGLSQGVNNCIFRDSKGFVWISSYDGLNKYDGVDCINYHSSPDNTNGLKGTLFLNILEDSHSNLWIGSNAGLNYYVRKENRFISFTHNNAANGQRFYSPFFIDDKENVWVQSGSAIYIFNKSNSSFALIDDSFPAGNLIIKPATSSGSMNKLYAISNNLPVLWEGSFKSKRINWRSITLPVDSRVLSFLPSAGGFWMGTEEDLYLFNGTKIEKLVETNGLRPQKVISLIIHNNELWAGTVKDGLYRIDPQTGAVKDHYANSVYNNYSLSGNQIHYLYADEKGDFWVSVWGKGVNYTNLNEFRFNHYLSKEEAVNAGVDNFIRSIIQVNNELWCGTQVSGILILNKDKKLISRIKSPLPASIEHLCQVENTIWAATLDGLFLIDSDTKKVTQLPRNDKPGEPSNQFNFLLPLDNGSVLASTNNGLYLVNAKAGKYFYSAVKGWKGNSKVFLTGYYDGNGFVYVSSPFSGFSVCRLVNDSLIFVKDFALDATIKCFTEQGDSILWIGTTSGIIKFDRKNREIKKLITEQDGLSNQFIYGIILDKDELWCSTNAGINSYNIKSSRVKSYTIGDGLQSNEFNTYSCCLTKEGELIFGGINGLNSFFPSNLGISSYKPELILTSIFVNDTAFNAVQPSLIKSLNLSYNQNTLGFQFTVLHYGNASANTITYMLEGYDKTWINSGNKVPVRYANIPPGDYTLRVRAYNADGVDAEVEYKLAIKIRAPWWQSWWFTLIAATSVAIIIYLISRSYVNKQIEKQRAEISRKEAINKERDRISRDMHDDLGSGLTMIAILSEVVKAQLKEPEKAKESLEKIADVSRDLVDNLQDIVWLLNPKNDTLENLSSYIREYGLKYFEPMPVMIDFDYPDEFSVKHLNDELRRNTFLCVKESFNNIAKYAECTKVEVSVCESFEQVKLTIKDNGRGFEPQSVRVFGNGLKNMKARIEKAGGKYSIVSAPGEGTYTEIRIPL